MSLSGMEISLLKTGWLQRIVDIASKIVGTELSSVEMLYQERLLMLLILCRPCQISKHVMCSWQYKLYSKQERKEINRGLSTKMFICQHYKNTASFSK